MAYADESSYEEMISILQKFIQSGSEACSLLERAGQDAVDNTDGDPAAKNSNDMIKSCSSNIRSQFKNIQGIIVALQDELEAIREAAAKASQY